MAKQAVAPATDDADPEAQPATSDGKNPHHQDRHLHHAGRLMTVLIVSVAGDLVG
jgi:hypothetical protein